MPYWHDDYFESKPRRPANGIKAKTQRGQFGKSWWASRWIAALERLVDTGRLSRGRSYARSGQVLNIDITPGHVASKVQGSRPTPYKVAIDVTPLDGKAWDKVIDAMAGQAIFAAKLLAGEMPQNVEEAFATAKVSLFPDRRGDLRTSCSCPDASNPCKHVAAVYYLLGEQFDEDPFLIFRLRGRAKEQVIAALRARRAGADAPLSASAGARPAEPDEQAPPLEQCLEGFWAWGQCAEPEQFRFSLTAPQIDAAPIKRLGAPPFWANKTEFNALLSQAYAAITAATLELALGDTGRAES